MALPNEQTLGGLMSLGGHSYSNTTVLGACKQTPQLYTHILPVLGFKLMTLNMLGKASVSEVHLDRVFLCFMISLTLFDEQ